MPKRRIVVIGAGHNGLIAANLLAEAGHQVTVLETRSVVGGACVTEELFPGYKVSSTSYVSTLLLPQAVVRFDLARHGYRVIRQDPAFFVPFEDGRSLTLHGDERDYSEIAKFSPADAETFLDFRSALERIGAFLKPLLLKPPPEIKSCAPRDLWGVLRMGLAARRLSHADLRLFAQLSTLGVADVVDAWFKSPEFKAFLCSQAVIGAYGGAHQPGTAFLLLHDVLGGVDGEAGVWGVVIGGMGMITKSLAAAAKERGVDIRINAPVAAITLHEDGRASGVRLKNGEVLPAHAVMSNATPRRTLLELLPPGTLPESVARHMKGFKDQGASLKVHLALSELPDFTAMPGKAPGPQHRGLIVMCPSVDFIEEAWRDCRRGEFAQRPMVEACIHSVLDPSCAPADKHIMSCFVQYGPRDLKTGSWEELKKTVIARTIAEIARYAPNVPEAVLHSHAYTPEDLEKQFGLTGGNIYHGAMTPDQLFSFRPAAGFSNYETPVKNLYLCGSGTHPGGGVWGAAGWNAAHEALRRL